MQYLWRSFWNIRINLKQNFDMLIRYKLYLEIISFLDYFFLCFIFVKFLFTGYLLSAYYV